MIKGLNIKGQNKEERYALASLINKEARLRQLNEKVFVKAFNNLAKEIKLNNVENLKLLMAIVEDVVMCEVERVNAELTSQFEAEGLANGFEDEVYYIQGYEDEICLMVIIENGVINVTMEDTRKANIYGDDTIIIEKTYKTVKGAVKFIEKYI